jgi:LDH2 family malate/lactate/ureidoglycolate dehydrogenase
LKKWQVEDLKRTVADICRASGIPADDAVMIADVLVTTDMRGIHSHGVVRLARYLDCIRAGGIKADAQPIILKESANSIMASAAGGLGIPSSVKIVRKLLDKAAENAISIATINHSDHYGAAGVYSMMAAERGFIGLSMSNTCPLVAPSGGRAAAIGNNPFAYAAPAGKHRAVLFDVCMSKVAAGKLVIAAEAGKKIPTDWILTKEGNVTDDPNEIWRDAVMLPFAEHKGYGFATLVETFTGVLAMAGMLSSVHSWNTKPGRDADTGHCFIVVNPEFFGGANEFKERVDAMIDELKRCPTVEGSQEVLYPGEIEWRREANALKNGIELPEASEKELLRAAQLAGVEVSI